jgi:hypothetical protein
MKKNDDRMGTFARFLSFVHSSPSSPVEEVNTRSDPRDSNFYYVMRQIARTLVESVLYFHISTQIASTMMLRLLPKA